MISTVIFDCDGVLVDSEVLIHEIELEVLASIGLAYESGPFKARFLGMSDKAYYEALDEDALARIGRTIQSEVRPIMRARIEKVFAERLAEVKGALETVKIVRQKKAVASSSGVKALDYKLKKLGLWEPFAPHIYSGEHVAHAKPAPDLFLYAAKMLGTEPSRCLVIEDSVNGVKAAVAAAMTVWGFAGGGHMDDQMSQNLTDAGATCVLADWTEVQSKLENL